MTPGASTSCFHCGEPLPAGTPLVALVGSAPQHVCCHGCKAVAEFISGAGLDDYYRYRDSHATRAAENPRGDRWSAYDRPELVARLSRAERDGARSITVLLEGLRCSACGWLADRALRMQAGVLDVSVNPATARARVVWNPEVVRLGELLRVLERSGLRPHPLAGAAAGEVALQERRSALKRMAVAGFGMMQVMMFALPLYVADTSDMTADIRALLRLVSMLISVPVALYAGWPFYAGAWQAVRGRSMSMDVPVTIGIALAFVASVWNALQGSGEVYFDSVTMFVFFLSLGRYVEMIARHRAGSVADALARLAPITARRVRGEVTEDVSAAEIGIEDRLLVRTGEIFAADGLVLEGEGRVDESMLTGEATPIGKGPGATVHAGTHNLGAPLQVRVTAVADQTVLAGIVALLERAQAERPRLARAADRAAGWFLSRILTGAALVFAVWWYLDPSRAFSATLAVLVVTCPCALSLATPAAIAAATAALARRGVLIARADALETLAKATHVVWDKTGTLTRGLVRVEEARVLSTLPQAQCLRLALALERMSEHPIARALLACGTAEEPAEQVTVATGEGLEGWVDGRRVRIGNFAFATGLAGAELSSALAQYDTDGWVCLGDETGLLAAYRLSDQLRSEAQGVVAALSTLGLQSEIASGDDASAVARIAARSGVQHWQHRMRPQDKLRRLQQLQSGGAVVIAIGDGINDAPLLKGADVAVAMGRGSALAQSSADLILVRDALDELPATIEVARRTMRIVRQNLVWAGVYNLAALPLAALGLVPPWLAAIGMSLSSILVVLNALRLSRDGAVNDTPWQSVRTVEAT
jgi:Cu2+-exporting ATPase